MTQMQQDQPDRQTDTNETETGFTVHTVDSAPDGSRPLLAQSLEMHGRIAGLHAVMAEAPGLLEGYRKLNELFRASSFDDEEITVVWQAINVEHNTAIAKGMKVDDAITEALRNETPLPTERLEALRIFTLAVVRERGLVDARAVRTFLDAGFTHRHVLEVILGLSQKVMSNYTNRLTLAPVDRAFAKFAWQKKPTTPGTMILDRLDPELAVILPELPAELADINRGNIGAMGRASDRTRPNTGPDRGARHSDGKGRPTGCSGVDLSKAVHSTASGLDMDSRWGIHPGLSRG